MKMSDDRYESVSVPVEEVKAESAKAILIVTEESEGWIPTSQIRDESEVWKKGDSGSLVIPRWLAEEKDLHYEEF